MSILHETHLLFYVISERQDAIMNGSNFCRLGFLNGYKSAEERCIHVSGTSFSTVELSGKESWGFQVEFNN